MYSECCIYPIVDSRSTAVISDEDRDLIFIREHVFVPKGVRCCANHLENKCLPYKSFKKLIIYGNKLVSFTSDDIKALFLKYRSTLETEKQIHFDQPSSLIDTDYYNLTGLRKQQFNKLVSLIPKSDVIRHSTKRSVRTAIGLLLCKLRLGLLNSVLASLFEMNDKKVISRAIDSAIKALMTDFVPKNIGFHHINRDNIIKNHTTTIAKKLMGSNKDVVIVVADGTYLYV